MKEWSTGQAIELIKRIKVETNSTRRNTNSQWDCKKDLYLLKWACEQALSQCANYDQETEYVKKYEHYQLLEKIKGPNV